MAIGRKKKLGMAIRRKKIMHKMKRKLGTANWRRKNATEWDLKEKPQNENGYIVFSEQVSSESRPIKKEM
jgi:predicted metal-dependent hydrolase